MQVCTTRSKANFKPEICCLEDSVKLLEGLGERTRSNLLDVHQCAVDYSAEGSVPEECINTVETGDCQTFHDIITYAL